MAATVMVASGHIVTFRYEGAARVMPVGGYDPPDGSEWRFQATMSVIDQAGKAGGPFIFYDDRPVKALMQRLFPSQLPAEKQCFNT